MSPLLEEVLYKLRELYPNLSIHIWEKFDRGKIFVDDHAIVKFNIDLIEKQLAIHGKESINETVKFFAEYIETRYIKRKNQFTKKRGYPAYNLTKAQIEYAIANTQSNNQAARFLNVHFNTWQKYAEKYGLYRGHIKPFGRGVPKPFSGPKIKMEDILAGKYPNFSLQQFKRRVVTEMILEEKCQRCGWTEKRPEDENAPLVLDFIDKNMKNKSRDNIRLLCYNCNYILNGKINRGNMMGKNPYIKKMLKEQKLNAEEKIDDVSIKPVAEEIQFEDAVTKISREEEEYNKLFDEFNKKS